MLFKVTRVKAVSGLTHSAVAKYHDADRLKEYVTEFITKNFAQVKQCSAWQQLDDDCLQEINIWRAGKM